MVSPDFHLVLGIVLAGAAAPGQTPVSDAKPAMRHSEIVFMYASDPEAYRAYAATFVAWGGAETRQQVKMHHDMGIRCTGAMWCLTAGAKLLHDDAALRGACSVDIEGKPIEVPWLFDHTYQGTKSYFGCTNNPVFREHNRKMVRQAMGGGADGLHVDDHLGVASSACWAGGGLCDHCMAAFREYLKARAGAPGSGMADQLKAAGVRDLGAFDYREIIRTYAATRQDYKKAQGRIPLMEVFLEFHLEAAAENVRQLAQLAAEVAGHPVLLSANAGLPSKWHTHVLKHLTHVVCEVDQAARAGTGRIDGALAAYRLATQLGKPLAATASGQDWAFVKANNCEDLVRFWIALAYAHGQRFMVPHPARQWCFTDKLGTHWYAAPVAAYSGLYRFISANAACFDDFEEADPKGVQSPKATLCTVRRKAGARTVLHVLNTDYDAAAGKIRPAAKVTVTFPRTLAGAGASSQPAKATLLSCDAPPQAVPALPEGENLKVELPELRLWTLVVLE